MLKDNISNQAYGFGDALGEIFLIVMVSFILGWIARWLWDEFIIPKEYEEEIIILDDNDDNKIQEEKEVIKENIKRIEKDGQEIIVIEKEKPSKRVFISPTGIKSDDLKIVEGIGPKIEALLKRNGIDNWEDLSKKTAEELKEILKNAGDRFTFHDPSTWPEQSMLAHQNKWDELEEFQEFLSGGKRV